ncbi:MAG: hypothetical protein UR23_C0006G0003 [Candidatus Roizmanbacteria bacterium GW2011_GWA2_32_13]|uniref:Uncharacterized protein n=1 Tax=Candidatus Roizmanbacteria bacterium GW2011_GWA2_32_13 TaxID=1618475 RepID=A0A0F9ZEC3_9BACT|nr:MAG: hypothetical protein UR23_C0006G0003 [Candidatus Roizmanbacteria bacterium GW2011_GWA2_32_13]
MKPSDKKKKTVSELIQLCQTMDPDLLYCWPKRKVTRDWLAETASVLKNLDEGDYQKFTQLSNIISPTEQREERKKAAYEIDNFIRNKTADYKRYDFSYLDKNSSLLSKISIPKWISDNLMQIIVAIIIAVILAWLKLK